LIGNANIPNAVSPQQALPTDVHITRTMKSFVRLKAAPFRFPKMDNAWIIFYLGQNASLKDARAS
jgi:hypothetical protein